MANDHYDDGISISHIAWIVLGIFAFLFGLTIIFGSWYTIDQSQRGVILRNGAIVGVAQPGLGFKLPLIDSINKFSFQSHIETFDNMESYSADQQVAQLKISVNYRLAADRVQEIYAQYGSSEGVINRLVRPHVFQQTKVVFGQYTAIRAIQERAKLNSDVAQSIQAAVTGPVIVESVQIENIDFSKTYEASIEQRMLAEVEVQKLRQNAEREKVQAQITVTRANAEADATRARAQAEAAAIELRGNAEAKVISLRASALAQNQNLIALTQAERWDGRLPSTMIPGQAVPMLGVK